MTTGLKAREVFHHRPRGLRPGEREIDAPAFVGTRLIKGALVGLAGGAAYLVTLMVIALTQGRSLLYPLRAIYAIFNGNRYLENYAIYPLDYGWFEVVKSVVWVASLGIIFVLPLVLFAPGRILRGGRVGTWLAIGVVWSMAVFFVAFSVLGFPAAPVVRRYGSSFQGARELGFWAFGVAHVVYGLVIGWLLCGRTKARIVVRHH